MLTSVALTSRPDRVAASLSSKEHSKIWVRSVKSVEKGSGLLSDKKAALWDGLSSPTLNDGSDGPQFYGLAFAAMGHKANAAEAKDHHEPG